MRTRMSDSGLIFRTIQWAAKNRDRILWRNPMKRILLSAALSALLTGWGSIPTEGQEAQPVFDVQNAARQPWQRAATGTTPSDRRWASAFIGTVPQGKRLVIEFVAVQW